MLTHRCKVRPPFVKMNSHAKKLHMEATQWVSLRARTSCTLFCDFFCSLIRSPFGLFYYQKGRTEACLN